MRFILNFFFFVVDILIGLILIVLQNLELFFYTIDTFQIVKGFFL